MLYIFFSTDESISDFIPYWDWTENSSVPKLALSGQWEKGPMKFGSQFGIGNSSFSVRGHNYQEIFNNQSFTKHLRKLTETSFCSTCFEEFQFLIQFPHNIVHNSFGDNSNMQSTAISSYDPIFYLHHNYIDRQYAYYQYLQKSRQRNVTHPKNPQMPPYSGITNSPFALGKPEVPNPFEITKINSRPNEGLDYENVFKYKYDNLLFQNAEPQDFDRTFTCTQKTSVGIHFRAPVPSKYEIYAISNDQDYIVGDYAILTPTKSDLLLEYDVTSALEEAGFTPNDKTLHFEIKSYDLDGNEIEGTFKPTSEYRGLDGTRRVRYHTQHFDKYNPSVTISKLSTQIEFLNEDGTFSNKVELHKA